MKIYKKLNTNFTVTSNEIFKYGLSLKAIGLYLYIVSKPNRWEFSIEGTNQQLKDGKDSIRGAISELEGSGFLVRRQVRNKEGKFGTGEWDITDKPMSENPTTDSTMSEKQIQVNTNQVSINKVNTKRERALTKFGSIKSLTDKEFGELAERYNVPIAFVISKYEDLTNYCEAKGKKYKDYLAALRNFVKQDSIKIRKEANEKSKITIITPDPDWNTEGVVT